jgi:flagellar assembly factor FliW
MNIDTSRFGTIDVDDMSIIRIPGGLIGFGRFTRFCIIQDRPDTPFKWLQSVENPDLAFVVIDPSQFFVDYEIEVSDEDAELLEIEEPEDAVVMTTVTINSDKRVTTNLLGPIVVNSRTLVGKQVVLQDENFNTKHCVGALEEETQTESEHCALKAAA